MASTYLSLHVHIVFATRGRVPSIADAWKRDLHSYLGGTTRRLGAVPVMIGGVEDHVHLLVALKGTHAVADLAREVKKVSSVWASERCKGFGWQEGYGAFSVSPGEVSRVATYIENQAEHHRQVSSADELRALLAEFGVDYNEKYFE